MEKLNCWQFNECGRAFDPSGREVLEGLESGEVCPVSVEILLDGIHSGDRAGRACWIVAGTLCGGKPMGSYGRKIESCMKCGFYAHVRKQEGDGFMQTAEIIGAAGSGTPALRSSYFKGAETPTDNIEKNFQSSLLAALQGSREACGFSEIRLLHMIRELGPGKAVRKMLDRQQFRHATDELARNNCLKYSVERLVLDYRFAGMFTDSQRMAAFVRLVNSGPDGLGSLLMGTDELPPAREAGSDN